VLLTNHVLSGALIGALTRRPAAAFTAGVASHFVLDAMPHWGKWADEHHFLQVAVPDGLISIAVMGALAAVSPPDRRLAVVAGMSGAVLPDMDKPSKLWFGRSPFPAAWDRFHSRIQHEAPRRVRLELAWAGAFAAATLITLRGSRPRQLTRPRPAGPGITRAADTAVRLGTPGRPG
jgi:hypothetical protein